MRGRVRSSVQALPVLGLLGLVVAPSAPATPPAGATSAAARPLVRIAVPAPDQLVRTGDVRLTVATRSGARLRKVELNGVDVTRRLRAGAGSRYTVRLALGSGLRYGVNDVTALSSGAASRGTYAHVEFRVAKRDPRLLALTGMRAGATTVPVSAFVRTAPGTGTRAYVNGRRADGAFATVPGGLVGRLGANDGLRHGVNRITILVDRTSASGRLTTYDVVRRTVRIRRGTPIAGAGDDRVVTVGRGVRLDARASEAAPGAGPLAFRWKLVARPEGSHATLRRATTARPGLTPDRPGTYLARVEVGGKETSSDTVTLEAGDDIPPIGRTFTTMGRDRGMSLGGEAIAGLRCCRGNVNYAVLDRGTLRVERSGSVRADVDGLRSLGAIVDGYGRGRDDLVALNWAGLIPQPTIAAVRDELGRVLSRIGADKLSAADEARLSSGTWPGSAIGIAGGAPGGAYVRLAYRDLGPSECESGPCDGFATIGSMSGSLRKSGETGKYDFVFTDSVDVDTAVGQTDVNPAPHAVSVAIGNASYPQPRPVAARAGFHLLRLNAYTLEPQLNTGYLTNLTNGNEDPDEVRRLAAALTASADQPDRPLVILQSFGAPHGQSANWGAVAQAVERLGGTRQVFIAMNTTDPRPLNGESADRRGQYAFIGRAGSAAPLAESSASLSGRPGRLSGLLMRARDGGYEPMLVGPPRPDGQTTVNTELTRIVNEPAEPFPAFKGPGGAPIDPAHVQAIENFLGGPQVTSLCSPTVTRCDFRRSYYESYGAPWSSIQDDLTNAERAKCPGPHDGFTEAECQAVRSQLRDEVSMVAKVTAYLGPAGLQQPFGAASVAALADVSQIAQEIKDAVRPPAADNTTSNVLRGISYVLRLGGFFPPPASQVAAGLSGAFAVAAYFTGSDGSPNLVGGTITTSASRLGPETAERYQRAGDTLDDVGRILVSDYGKLRTVAARTNAAPGPGELDWRLGTVGLARDALRRATRQMIYERLVPLAFPRLYDVGRVANARNWYCDGGIAYDKHLFGNQVDDAQFYARFPRAPTSYTTLVAAAAAHATGSLHSARIPGPPASVTDALFKDPGQGGLGLNKLAFYSARNGFSYFPADPQPISTEDRRGNWSSLSMFPIGTNYVIQCTDVPSPPGNSG